MKTSSIALSLALAGFAAGANASTDDEIFRNGFDNVCRAAACLLQIDGFTGTGTIHGMGTTDHTSFLWLNRFSPEPADFPFALREVDIDFGTNGIAAYEKFDVYIYTDDDHDPTNGATLALALRGVMVENPLGAMQTVLFPYDLQLIDPCDILIAIVNRDAAGSFPAKADDGVAFAGRSWAGGFGMAIADPPDLAQLELQLAPDAVPGFTHNWILRG
ncbi:MAG TPA: hypothetical protein VF132_05515, partial [Rudaea sp.]